MKSVGGKGKIGVLIDSIIIASRTTAAKGMECLRRSRKVEKHNVSKALPSHPSSSPSVEYYGPVAGSPCVWLILRQLIIIAFNLLHASSNES